MKKGEKQKMDRPKCAVKGCEKGALLLYGNKWICGYCYMKINNKMLEEKNKLIEELEV